MEQLIERINKLAVPVKAGIIAGIILLSTGGTYFLLVSDIEDKLIAIKADQATSEGVLAEKQAIADNLNEKRRELDALEQDFQKALIALPEKKDMEELLSQLNVVGKKAGLEINKVTPGAETAEDFKARIPISMSVSGNYQEIAMFLQEVARLERIVNVSDLKLASPVVKADKVTLKADFTATTFRFNDAATKPKTGKP